jgi:hypothetical protein
VGPLSWGKLSPDLTNHLHSATIRSFCAVVLVAIQKILLNLQLSISNNP